MKHLKEKQEFRYANPNPDIMDTFLAPNVSQVVLTCTEFTSLCPITGQPDYSFLTITYTPNKRCIESKSLKLYLGAYRQVGAFTEQLTQRIYRDLKEVLQPEELTLEIKSVSRGGISITAFKGDLI